MTDARRPANRCRRSLHSLSFAPRKSRRSRKRGLPGRRVRAQGRTVTPESAAWPPARRSRPWSPHTERRASSACTSLSPSGARLCNVQARSSSTVGLSFSSSMPLTRRVLVVLGFVIAGAVLGAQNRPLPDQESFVRETRKHLQTDSVLQSSYVYVETRRELKLDKKGRTSEESVKVFESYPGLPGEARWERLVAEDGRPVPAPELTKQDRE